MNTTVRRVAAILGCLAVLAVQIVSLLLDALMSAFTNPIIDTSRVPGQDVFSVHPIVVIASWILLLVGWREWWLWFLALGIGLVSPVLFLALGLTGKA